MTLTGSWFRSCKENGLSIWQNSTQNPSQVGAYFGHEMSKCRKRLWNLYKYKHFLLKAYFSWPYCIKCTWKFFKNFAASVAFYQNRPITPPWLKKTGSNSSDNFVTKSFRLFTKRKLSILWNFPFRVYFQPGNANFGLENHHMVNARQPFCWK